MCLGVISSFNEDRISRDLNAIKLSGLFLLLFPNLSLPPLLPTTFCDQNQFSYRRKMLIAVTLLIHLSGHFTL